MCGNGHSLNGRLRAMIGFAYEYVESDEDGNITARFDGEHLMVGYHLPGKVSGWPQYQIGGHTVAISPDTLARLVGKMLKLKKKTGHSDIAPYVLVAA